MIRRLERPLSIARRLLADKANSTKQYNDHPYVAKISDVPKGFDPNLDDSTFSHAPPGFKPMLLRQFVHEWLYGTGGYFQQAAIPVHKARSIPFKQLANRDEYHKVLRQFYTEGNNQFVTPSELFSPWFGKMFGEILVRGHGCHEGNGEREPLVVYEVGAGNGTFALDVLNHVRSHYPEVYSDMEYHTVEISKPLHDIQRARLVGHVEAGRCWNHLGDALDWSIPDQRHCFVVLMEVLDNMPHDLVEWSSDGEPRETWVFADEGVLHEGSVPVKDSLIRRYLEVYLSYPELQRIERRAAEESLTWAQRLSRHFQFFVDASETSGPRMFVPTSSFSFLERIRAYVPNARLVAADFHHLEKTLHGLNAPRVQFLVRGQGIVTDTYLGPKGLLDIFFPTDFKALSLVEGHVFQRAPGEIMLPSQMAREYLPEAIEETSTKSGFSPLIEEFENTSVYVASRKDDKTSHDRT